MEAPQSPWIGADMVEASPQGQIVLCFLQPKAGAAVCSACHSAYGSLQQHLDALQ